MDLEHASGACIRGGGKNYTGGEKLFADLRAKLFWHTIYCANSISDAGSYSGSWFHMGLGSQAPQIMHEYELVTEI